MFTATGTNRGNLVTEIVYKSTLLAKQISTPLHDCRSFYWRLIGNCAANIIGITPTFHLPTDGDLEKSMLVVTAINKISELIDDGYLTPAERIVAYKKLHHALSAHVDHVEAYCASSAITSLDHNA